MNGLNNNIIKKILILQYKMNRSLNNQIYMNNQIMDNNILTNRPYRSQHFWKYFL